LKSARYVIDGLSRKLRRDLFSEGVKSLCPPRRANLRPAAEGEGRGEC
jgi:hypothetical protein